MENACPACGNLANFVTILVDKNQETYEIYECPLCGLAFVGSEVQLEQVQNFYDEEFYDSKMCAAANPLRERLEREVVRKQLMKLAEFIETPGRFLDVGCGDGVHLKLFREAGWQVSGTEISSFAVHHIGEEYGIEVFLGSLVDAPFNASQFHLIQMRHVLEHLVDPRPTLQRAFELLRPGGMICIDTPNRGLASRLRMAVNSLSTLPPRLQALSLPNQSRPSDTWGNLHPPEHNLWFTSVGMKKLLQATGFHLRWFKTAYRGDTRHFPSKFLLAGQKMGLWDRIWFCADAVGAALGDGDVLVVYATRP